MRIFSQKINIFKFFNGKLIFFSFFLVIFLGFFANIALAVGPFAPGTVDNPQCLPSDSNCDVIPPLTAETEPAFTASPAFNIIASDISNWNAKLSSFTETDPIFSAWNKSSGISITKSQISDFPSALSSFVNDLGNYGNFVTGTPWTLMGYLTAETDPVFLASQAHNITDTDITHLSNLSGINTGDETQTTIINKLGFTPYNSTNPNNYISSAGAPVQSVAGRTGAITLSQSDIPGLLTSSSPSFAGGSFAGKINVGNGSDSNQNILEVTSGHSIRNPILSYSADTFTIGGEDGLTLSSAKDSIEEQAFFRAKANADAHLYAQTTNTNNIASLVAMYNPNADTSNLSSANQFMLALNTTGNKEGKLQYQYGASSPQDAMVVTPLNTTSNSISSVVFPSGNIGIRNNSPSATLDMTGTFNQTATNASGSGMAITANSLTNGNAMTILVNAVGANNNLQKGMNVVMTGANASSQQTTYGLYSTNTHTGVNSTNVGGYFNASGGTNNYGLIVGSGNVGIGTTTPSATLQVAGNEIVGDNLSIGTFPNKALQIGNTSGDSFIYLGQGDSNNLNFGWHYNASAGSATAALATYGYNNPLYIDASVLALQSQNITGRVGIGITNPGYKLDVNGSIGNSNGALSFYSGGTNQNITFNPSGNGSNIFNSNPGENWVITNNFLNNYAGIGPGVASFLAPNTIATGEGSASGPFFAFGVDKSNNNAGTLGLVYRGNGSATNYLQVGLWGTQAPLSIFPSSVIIGNPTNPLVNNGNTFQVNGASSFMNGNVGIGTTNPDYQLDVNGDLNVSGEIYKNGSPVGGANIYLLDPSLTSPTNPYIAGSHGEDIIRIKDGTDQEPYDNYDSNDSSRGGMAAFIFMPNDQSDSTPDVTTTTSDGQTAWEIGNNLPHLKKITVYGNRYDSNCSRMVLIMSDNGAYDNGRYFSDIYADTNGFNGKVIIQDPMRNAITFTYGGPGMQNGAGQQWQYDYSPSFFGADNADGFGNYAKLNDDGNLTRYTWYGHSQGGGDIYYNDGKVGIGTTSLCPDCKLDVVGDNYSYIRSYSTDGTDGGIFLASNDNNGNYRQWALFSQGGNNGSPDFTINDDYTGQTRFVIKANSGNIGVGSTNPSAKFNVYKDTSADLNLSDGSYVDVALAGNPASNFNGPVRGMYIDYNDPDNNLNSFGLQVDSNSGEASAKFHHSGNNGGASLLLEQEADSEVISGYSSGIVNSSYFSLLQDTSTFSGNGIELNFANGSGTFDGNFLYFENGGDQMFAIDSNGNVSANGTITGSNISGTNTGDNATNSQYSGLASSKQNALNGTGLVRMNGTNVSYDNTSYVSGTPWTGMGYLTSTLSSQMTWNYDGDQQLMGNTDASLFHVGSYAKNSGTLAGLINTAHGSSVDFSHYYLTHNVSTPSNGIFTTTNDTTSSSYIWSMSDVGYLDIFKAPAVGGAGAPVFNPTPTFSMNMITGDTGIGVAASSNARLAVMGGNVGIGTTTPTYTLDIKDSGTGIRWTGTNNYFSVKDWSVSGSYGPQIVTDHDSIVFPTTTYFGDSSSYFKRESSVTRVHGDSGVKLSYYNGSILTGLTLNNSGNVGIGTTTPGYKLDVGSLTAGGTANIAGTLGLELVPSFAPANWTATNGWSANTTTLNLVDNASASQIVPSTPITSVIGNKYRITYTASGVTGTIFITLGGVRTANISNGTITTDIFATTTGTLNITANAHATAVISALSVKNITDGTLVVNNKINTNQLSLGVGSAKTDTEVLHVHNGNILVQSDEGSANQRWIGLTTANGFGTEGFKFFYDGTTGNTNFDNYYSAGKMNFRVHSISSQVNAMTIDSAGNVGIGITAPSALLEIAKNNLRLTPTISSLLSNSTASDATNTIQYSPALSFLSSRWNTSTLASQTSQWRIYNQPLAGSGTAGTLTFEHSTDGGAYTTLLNLYSSGVLTGSIGAFTNSIYAYPATTTTSTDGIYTLAAASTAGIPVRYSPRFRLTGTAWNSTTPASNTINFINEVRPTSGATTSGTMYWAYDNNGGGYGDLMTLSAGGTLGVQQLTSTGQINAYRSMAATSAIGFWAVPNTNSTSVIPVRYSPSLTMTGYAWNTTPTAANNSINFSQEVIPVSGATTSGALRWSYDNNGGGYSELMRLSSAGKLGIGTNAPSNMLSVVGLAGDTTVVSIGTTSGNTCSFSTTTGSFSCASDQRLKYDISSIDGDSALSKLVSLNPVVFHYNWQNSTDPLVSGFIAQEFENTFPELVSTDSITGYKSLSYMPLIPYTVKAIQEMNIKIIDINNFEKQNDWRDSFIAWFSNAENHITRIFTGEVCLTDPGEDPVCLNRTELKSLKALLNNPNSGTTSGGGGGSTSGTCSDGIMNQDETGIDIGGVCTPSTPSAPLTCDAPKILVDGACIDAPLPTPPNPPDCTSPQTLVNGVCTDPQVVNPE